MLTASFLLGHLPHFYHNHFPHFFPVHSSCPLAAYLGLNGGRVNIPVVTNFFYNFIYIWFIFHLCMITFYFFAELQSLLANSFSPSCLFVKCYIGWGDKGAAQLHTLPTTCEPDNRRSVTDHPKTDFTRSHLIGHRSCCPSVICIMICRLKIN